MTLLFWNFDGNLHIMGVYFYILIEIVHEEPNIFKKEKENPCLDGDFLAGLMRNL